MPLTLSVVLWTPGRRMGTIFAPLESRRSWAFWAIDEGCRLRTQISLVRPLTVGVVRVSGRAWLEERVRAGRTVDAAEERVPALVLGALDDDLGGRVVVGDAGEHAGLEEGAHALVGALVLGVLDDELVARAGEGGRGRGCGRGQGGAEGCAKDARGHGVLAVESVVVVEREPVDRERDEDEDESGRP